MLKIYRSIENLKIECPLFFSPVRAGFPSPAEDYIEKKLDLNELILKRPSSTYYVRAEGTSMEDQNLHDGDILIVDKSIRPMFGHVVIASVFGEFTVKTYGKIKDKPALIPANPKFKPIFINEDSETSIWGVVTYGIHNMIPKWKQYI